MQILKSPKLSFYSFESWPNLGKDTFSTGFLYATASYFISKYDCETGRPVYNHIGGSFYNDYKVALKKYAGL